MQIFRIGQSKGAQRIGYARDPEAELQRLKAGHPDGLSMRTWEVATGEAMLADKLLRKRLADSLKGDGWYSGSVASLDAEIEKALRDVSEDRVAELSEFLPGDYAQTMVHIRTQVFETTQEMIGIIAGRSPPVVSKWESGKNNPGVPELLRLRSYALALDLPWQDGFLLGSTAATLLNKEMT